MRGGAAVRVTADLAGLGMLAVYTARMSEMEEV
jgi:hypothetical protein